MSNLNDLLKRCQSGDLNAFDELFRLYEDRVYRLALTILQDEKDAEDSVQETFLRVFRSISAYRWEASFNTWVTALTVNTCRDHLRRRKLRQVISLHGLHHKPDLSRADVPDMVDRNIQQQAIWRSVNRMDEKYRLPVLLVYQEALSVTETAQIMGLPVRTVYARLKHAYNQLSQELQETPLIPVQDLDGEKC